MSDHPEVSISGLSSAGEGVGRLDDGLVVFVAGALAGERVRVEVSDRRRRFARGQVVEVLDPSPDRTSYACPTWHAGCGGCDLAHLAPDGQVRAKQQIVTDALTRIGKLPLVPTVEPGPRLATAGFRTTARAVVVDGRAAFRRHGSRAAVPVERCDVAHPLLEELLTEAAYGAATEVTMRVGAATGERIVVVDGPADGVRVPADVCVVTSDAVRAGARRWIHEEIDGRRFRVSGGSFFQTRADGAAALVDTVRDGFGATAGFAAKTDGGAGLGRLVDLCGGVGLFAATLASTSVELVESNRSAAADARFNLADRGDAAQVSTVAFEQWRPCPADAVVADPARTGLGAAGVAAVTGTGAAAVVLVSCDAGSLGRDAGLLAGQGYRLTRCTLVDLFPHTSRVEVVSVFERVESDPTTPA